MNYEKYKSSENDWVGEIPSHWGIIKLKYAALVQPSNVDKKQNEGEAKVLLCNYVDVYKNEFIDETIKFMEATASENEIQKFKIQEGDVLITKDSETPDDIAIPAFVSKDLDNVLCGYHLALLRSQKDILKGFYLYYLFKSYKFNQQFTIAANGITRFGLSADDVRNAFISIPPISEQSIIANFLYHKTHQMDDLIAKKQKLIELLKEERTEIINQAVTKGLDPDVPMKGSGVEWLGRLPAHWGLKRLKHLVNPKLQYGANETGIDYNPIYPRYIRITDFDQDGNLRNDTLLSLDPQIAQNYLLNEGDVLFARSGATVGKTFIYQESDGNACFAGYLIKATTIISVLLSDFLYYLTQSNYYDNWKESIFSQATIQNIGANKYEDFLVPLPSIREQNEIVLFIEDKSEYIKSSILKIEKEIELISEYKTSLINEAITGKIDVRDYQISHA